MALSSYSDLASAIAGWLNRADLTARIPEFIALAEAEFNREMRTLEMESRATATLTSDAVAVPDDFLGLRSIQIDNTALDYITPSELFEDATTGTPIFYTVSDGQFFFRPAPSSGTVTIDYYAVIPELTSVDTSNWLLLKHPDLYLFATLLQAEFYGWNDTRLPLIKSRVEEIMDQITGAVSKERYGGRRLVAKSRVPQVRNIRA